MFRIIFARPENSAELYYALTGIKCTPCEIQIITLTTTISGKQKNDLAFVVRGKLLKIPTPELVIFYNGTETRPEKEILKLSSAFEVTGLARKEVENLCINS